MRVYGVTTLQHHSTLTFRDHHRVNLAPSINARPAVPELAITVPTSDPHATIARQRQAVLEPG